MVREGRVLISVATDPDFGAGFLVTAYEVGAQVANASSSTTVNVRAGHGFAAGDKLMVGIDINRYREVLSVTDTTIEADSPVSVAAGEFIVNLGTDTGLGGPSYNGSGADIYTDMAFVNQAIDSTVVTDSTGRYRYFHRRNHRWELVRTSTGSPYAVYMDEIRDDDGIAERRAVDYATGGSGTSGDPYTGWYGAVAANTRTVFDANAYFGLSSDLTVPAGATLEGGGPSSVLLVTANDTAVINATNAGDISIRNLKMDCQRSLYAVVPLRNGFEFTQGTGQNYLFENLHVTGANKAGIRMTGGSTRTNCIVRGCTVTDCGWHGIEYQDLTTWSHIEGNYCDGNNVTTLGAQIYLSGPHGDDPTEACSIIGNKITNSGDNGIRVMGNYQTVIGNTIILGDNDGIRLNGTFNTCVGNIVVSVGGAGIKWDSLTDSTICGNTVVSCGTHGIWGRVDPVPNGFPAGSSGRNAITGNTVRGSGIDGIRLANITNAETESIVANNMIYTSGTSGIDLGGGVRCLVQGNLLRGNVASITDAGTANQCLNNIHEATGTYGPDVDSATTITLPAIGETFQINGTTSITSVTASWPGRKVTLWFADALTFTDGSNLLIAGNLVTTINDTISLVCDGTNWIETGRSVN